MLKSIMSNSRKLRKWLFDLLQTENNTAFLSELERIDPQKLISPLFSTLYSKDPVIRWHGITSFGLVVPIIAAQSLEAARVVMRRFIWNLNDESGGIGWGSPESMGEIMANHKKLADEYHKILLSFVWDREGPDNFLEYAPLREGAYWGIARLSQAFPELVQPGQEFLLHNLSGEQSPYAQAYIYLALLQIIPTGDLAHKLSRINLSEKSILVYWNNHFVQTSMQELIKMGQDFAISGQK